MRRKAASSVPGPESRDVGAGRPGSVGPCQTSTEGKSGNMKTSGRQIREYKVQSWTCLLQPSPQDGGNGELKAHLSVSSEKTLWNTESWRFMGSIHMI